MRKADFRPSLLLSSMIHKGVFFAILVLLTTATAKGQALTSYHHNTFWGRIVLSDKISSKLKWELYLQKRTQNDPDHKLDIFRHDQLTSYWLWLHYQASKELRISITPFCYFNTKALFPQPPDVGSRGIKELRWAAQLEHTQKLKYFTFANRYSLEYRNRDLEQEGAFVTNFRMRYRAKLERAINRRFSVIAYDEIFLEFGKAIESSPAVFNQNRLYGGFSYEVVKNIKFTLGYMYLIQERPTGKAFDKANVVWGILTFDNIFSQFKSKKEG
jgi:hypothetical protein